MKNNIVYEECMKILNSNNFKNEVRIFIKPLLEYILKPNPCASSKLIAN